MEKKENYNEKIWVENYSIDKVSDSIFKNIKKLIKDIEEIVLIEYIYFFILNYNIEVKFDFDVCFKLLNKIKFSYKNNFNEIIKEYILINNEKYYLIKINSEMLVFKNGFDFSFILFGNIFKEKYLLGFFIDEYSKKGLMNYLIFQQIKGIFKLNNIV